MKIKKILAALAASAMAMTMMGATVFAEGVTADDDVIDDGDEYIDDVDVDDTDDTDDIDDVDVDDVDVVDVVDEPVANPTAGNAPIALAVIPVALAAAAVVAKKAK